MSLPYTVYVCELVYVYVCVCDSICVCRVAVINNSCFSFEFIITCILVDGTKVNKNKVIAEVSEAPFIAVIADVHRCFCPKSTNISY